MTCDGLVEISSKINLIHKCFHATQKWLQYITQSNGVLLGLDISYILLELLILFINDIFAIFTDSLRVVLVHCYCCV